MQDPKEMVALMTPTWFPVPQKNLYLLVLKFEEKYEEWKKKAIDGKNFIDVKGYVSGNKIYIYNKQ